MKSPSILNTSRCTRLLKSCKRWFMSSAICGSTTTATRRVRRTTMRSGRQKWKVSDLCPPPPGDPVVRKSARRLMTIRSSVAASSASHWNCSRGQFALSWFDRFPVRVEQQKDMTAVIEQWRETLALAHQNAEAGIDIEAVLSMALLPSVSPQNGSHSDDMAGSNDNDLSVAAFEDKPKRNKVKYQCRGRGAAVWGQSRTEY